MDLLKQHEDNVAESRAKFNILKKQMEENA